MLLLQEVQYNAEQEVELKEAHFIMGSNSGHRGWKFIYPRSPTGLRF